MPGWRILSTPQFRYGAKVAIAALVAYALTLGKRNDYALFTGCGAHSTR
jgi:hypothetical protein